MQRQMIEESSVTNALMTKGVQRRSCWRAAPACVAYVTGGGPLGNLGNFLSCGAPMAVIRWARSRSARKMTVNGGQGSQRQSHKGPQPRGYVLMLASTTERTSADQNHRTKRYRRHGCCGPQPQKRRRNRLRPARRKKARVYRHGFVG